MNYWYRLMRFFFYSAIKNHPSAKNKHRLLSLASVKTVGIVFDGTATSDVAVVENFANDLRSKNIQVETLYYLPKEKNAIAKPNSFSGKEVSITHKPQGAIVEQFCSKKTDILFALFQHENLPLEFVVLTANATCRVGLYSPEKTNCFELMIKPAATATLSDNIKQAITLLNQVNND
jgi:hypothetical protein